MPDWRHLVALGAVAGLPTVAGTVLGGLAYSALLGTLFLAVGVGAIAEVVRELARFMWRAAEDHAAVLAGAAAGFVFMYGTALLIGA